MLGKKYIPLFPRRREFLDPRVKPEDDIVESEDDIVESEDDRRIHKENP